MYYFTSDYTEGCTPEILEALAATNFEQTGGYGIDPYCETAALLIKKECGRSDIDVHFMTGGTQTNLTIICAALRPFHGVYGTVQSHINTHEAGAIERTGHKVIDLPTSDGKITAAMIRQQHELYLGDPSREHLVQPKMVYISQPTEIGSLYHKEELEALYAVCRHYGLYYKICRHGVELALQIKAAVQERGLGFVTDSTTNQQFIIFPQAMYDELSKQFALAPWEYMDDGRIAARICTSWATDPTQVDRLCNMIKAL